METAEILARLVERINGMSAAELQARGAFPVVRPVKPLDGWPDWARLVPEGCSRDCCQGLVNVMAVVVALTLAQQMGWVENGPPDDLEETAMGLACAAEHGIEPMRDPETIRRIVPELCREAAKEGRPIRLKLDGKCGDALRN